MPLSKQQETAAALVADDKLTDEEIGKRCKVSRQTIYNWKRDPFFAVRVEEHRAEWRRAVMSSGIAVKENRIARLNDTWLRLQTVITDQAQEYSELMDGAPLSEEDVVPRKARTGVVVKSVTYLKEGKRIEWTVDTAPLAEMRAMEQQAARELGQWVEKQDVEIRDSTAKQSLKRKLVSKSKSGSD